MKKKKWIKRICFYFLALLLIVFIEIYVVETIKWQGGINKSIDTSIENMVEKVIPSVVHIQYKGEYGNWQGSGVIISKDGIILTARHIVECPGIFTVTLNDGRQFITDKACMSKEYDVGFLKISVENLSVSKLGDSDKVKLGSSLFAISSQFGMKGFNSVTSGIFSAKRTYLGETEYGRTEYGWSILLQTDTGANRGSSGGPLFNIKGEVIGIIVGGPVFPYAGIIYCIPSNVCKDFIKIVPTVFDLQEVLPVSDGLLNKQLIGLKNKVESFENQINDLEDRVSESLSGFDSNVLGVPD